MYGSISAHPASPQEQTQRQSELVCLSREPRSEPTLSAVWKLKCLESILGIKRCVCVASADPRSVVQRQEALEASRRKMQEEQDARATEFKEKQQRVSLMW